MANHFEQSNILLCGSPRVGKSTLINSIFQQNLAKSHASLNSFTKKIARYSYEYSNGQITHETIIWDTPGIESWNENQVRRYMASLIKQTQPLCMIYCASPGSFAGLDHVAWLVEECHKKNIFCALVCTNMWSGRNREDIVDEFCRILNIVHSNISSTREDNIIYYDRIALVTMVNSEEYIDNIFDIRKPSSGVEELIFGIAKCLERDLMFAWFRSVIYNKSFWSKMSLKLSDLFQMPIDTFNSLSKHMTNIFNFLSTIFNSTSIDNNNNKSSLTSKTDDDLVVDVQMSDTSEQIHRKKLLFTLESNDIMMAAELNQALSKLGAKSSKTEELKRENKQFLTVTAEFKNNESINALYKLWQSASTTKTQCTIIDEQYSNSQVENHLK